jgi:RNA polymerase sigma-70 factor, ECF subfamily
MEPDSGNITGPERVKTPMHLTLSEVERLQATADDAEVAFAMDEDAFRAFYDRTSRALWGYLSRMTGDGHLADDLLQESYYRFLRAQVDYESEAHRRNYLFRIATNLVRDSRRRQRTSVQTVEVDLATVSSGETDASAAVARNADLQRAMSQLKPRERELLWLAYAQGSSHKEIGEVLGLKTGSIKLLLFRARRKLAGIIAREPQTAGGRP